MTMADATIHPGKNCRRCPRLASFRDENRDNNPDWFNCPVPSFGDRNAWLAVVGLAPGLKGANRTGRPFTGDGSGDLLFDALAKIGCVRGEYRGSADDGMTLSGTIILNAVRCVPPQNRPLGGEVTNCRDFLINELGSLPQLSAIVALGTVAHGAIVRGYGLRLADHRFGHASEHRLPGGRRLIDSYHCSRYNQNTGRLTAAMFDAVFARAREFGP